MYFKNLQILPKILILYINLVFKSINNDLYEKKKTMIYMTL